MRTVRAQVDVPGSVSAAEALWYDTGRWPAFVDGFGHLGKVEGDWPAAGSVVTWSSPPGGRELVIERVERYEPRVGQTLQVEDSKLRGVQRVAFEPLEGGAGVSLELDYDLKERHFGGPLADLFFIRRALADSLRRTLVRFARELRADREMS
jgi:hypothetical protein